MDPGTPLLGAAAPVAAADKARLRAGHSGRAAPPGDAGNPAPTRAGALVGALLVLYRALALLYRANNATHKFFQRITDSGQRMFGGICAEALTLDEKGRLTVRIYDSYPDYFTVGDKLYAWEEPWFGRRLPAAPAQVLVGACGTGREAVALAARGYRVDALEPAPEFVEESRRRLGAQSAVHNLSYEQLSAILLDGKDLLQGALHTAHYDAVILGSGSLTHVLDPGEQARLLRALVLLCPDGPILASFFCETEDAPVRHGRATHLGRRLGRAVARARKMPPAHSDRLSYRAHSGFAYTFTPREIEQLAQSVGRRVAWEHDNFNMQPFHYATFLPP